MGWGWGDKYLKAKAANYDGIFTELWGPLLKERIDVQ